ncbi:hypothetical protein BH09SUM1_BH09SUM1_29090 [soil metagenome]
MTLKHLPLLAVLALMAAAPSTSRANVYASALSATDGGANYAISFRLNEAATSVTVEVLDNTLAVVKTIAGGALAKGANTVNWDKTNNSSVAVPSGTYTFRVVAADSTGHADWFKISDDTSAQTQFFSAKGVQVNKNQASDFFGRVYVAENAGQTGSGGRLTGVAGTNDGIFVLSADLADITSQGNSAYASAVGWTSSASSPYALALSDDGFLYISDWTDTNAQVWVMQENALTTTPTALFGPDAIGVGGIRNNGTADYQGSIQMLRAFGTGSGKYLMTIDEDITVAGANPGSILRYDVGNAVTNYNTVPTVVYDDTVNGDLIKNAENGFSFDPAGNIWISQYRATDGAAVPSLIRYNTTTSAVDFNSFNNLPGPFNASNRGKNAINPAGNTLALSASASLRILDITAFPPTLTKTIGATEGYSGTNTYQLDWDAAGNLYSVSTSAERLRVFSPPGANTFTTSSPTAAAMTIVADVQDWMNY